MRAANLVNRRPIQPCLLLPFTFRGICFPSVRQCLCRGCLPLLGFPSAMSSEMLGPAFQPTTTLSHNRPYQPHCTLLSNAILHYTILYNAMLGHTMLQRKSPDIFIKEFYFWNVTEETMTGMNKSKEFKASIMSNERLFVGVCHPILLLWLGKKKPKKKRFLNRKNILTQVIRK